MKRTIHALIGSLLFLVGVSAVVAGEQGHYNPGMLGTRDFFVPATPGWYFAQYDMFYMSDDFMNGGGNRVSNLSASRSLDVTRTFSGSGSFGLQSSRGANRSQVISFPGNNINLGLQLDSQSTTTANLSINASARARLRARVDVDAHLTALDLDLDGFAPTIIWSAKEKVLGARYAAYVSVPFIYLSIDAKLEGTVSAIASVKGKATITASGTATNTTSLNSSVDVSGSDGQPIGGKTKGSSVTVSKSGSKTVTVPFRASARGKKDFSFEISESATDIGDIFVQPLWLDWSGKHYDIAFGEGVYMPTGTYSNGAADNTGLGFWTNQMQLAGAWYPFDNQGTALAVAATYEIHGDVRGVDIRPGNNFTLNWGLSQFLPLEKSMTWLVDVGVVGYDTWQVTDDTGSDIRYDPSVHDEVHAWGFQIGLIQTKWNAAITARWLHEYGARDRFEGDVFAANLAVKF